MQEDNIDLQQEAKDLVLAELEKNGVINFMRANIKKSILEFYNNEELLMKMYLNSIFILVNKKLNINHEYIQKRKLIMIE